MRQFKNTQQSVRLDVSRILTQPQLPSIAKRPKLTDSIYVFLLPCAIILWSISLKEINLRQMNALGLVSVLPPAIIIALIILTISFCLSLRQPRLRVPVLLLHLVLLIFMLYALESIIEEVPRFTVVYRHAGYTEYIMRTGAVDPNLDAYFSWPGFFVLSALATQLSGYNSILSYAAWAPLFFNLIYCGPMYMIFTSATTNKRLVWLALWFFFLTNWIGQDYFSPQGLNFFLYLFIIAILLKWFKLVPRAQPHIWRHSWQRLGGSSLLMQKLYEWLTTEDKLHTPSYPRQRVALLVILVTIFAFVVFSHPLTPFFVLASVTVLVIFRRCTPFWLPILMGIMTVAWIIFMAKAFLVGHSYMVVGNFGHVSNNITSNVTNRVAKGDPQHNFIAEMRVIMTVFIGGLAFAGGILRLRKGYLDLNYILLAITPFPLILAGNYGGEMFLRIYLFALPLIVFFAAALFYPKHTLSLRGMSPWMTVAVTVTSIMLLAGFLFTRYGNESWDYITPAEYEGVRYLYSIAQPNSIFIEGWNDTPWQFQDYEKYSVYSMAEILPDEVTTQNVDAIVKYIRTQKSRNTYLIFTRAQKIDSESFYGLPHGSLDRLEDALLKSGKFKMIYNNSDVQIFTIINVSQGDVPVHTYNSMLASGHSQELSLF